jgi:hypothetical protein
LLDCVLCFHKKNQLDNQGNLMAFQSKTSQIIAEAQAYAANLAAIAPELDVGTCLTLAIFKAQIAAAQNAFDIYNGLLAQSNNSARQFQKGEVSPQLLPARLLPETGGQCVNESCESTSIGRAGSCAINRQLHPPKEGLGGWAYCWENGQLRQGL